MFNNVGNSIKGLAKFFFIIGFIASCIAGVKLGELAGKFSSDESTEYIVMSVIIIVGAFLSWVFSLCLYGFGEIVENSCIIADKINKSPKKKKLAYVKSFEVPEEEIEEPEQDEDYLDIICPHCEGVMSYTKKVLLTEDTLNCPLCGKAFETRDVIV